MNQTEKISVDGLDLDGLDLWTYFYAVPVNRQHDPGEVVLPVLCGDGEITTFVSRTVPSVDVLAHILAIARSAPAERAADREQMKLILSEIEV